MLVIGLMSGTSLDGIDAALVEFEGEEPGRLRWQVRGFHTTPYSPEQRDQIHSAILDGGAAELCALHAGLGEWFAAAALELCRSAGVQPEHVDLVGSHGQTVWHEPPAAGRRGATLQLGCAATIAERTGIPVVSDFRARDVAAGGEGAPLVPWVDRVLFAAAGKRRVLQNIGGMANLTWLPPRGEPGPAIAFDTGPGNALIDAAVELASGGRERYDRDGARARRGRIQEELLAELLGHPFFRRTPPKSTGREVFGRPYVQALVDRLRPGHAQAWDDLVATLTALTARSIGRAYRAWVLPRGVEEVLVTGGGARNPVLRSMLQQEFAPASVLPGEALGLDPDAKEAVAFAALAWAHVRGFAGNVPEATGAAGERVLGSYTPGNRSRQSTVYSSQ
ncbi:MAG: anhydro-N-acetylmuramic acid kinase [Gemmatimonadetes bacterium]|nr:anhydro-N-acetylmuramic acid kinase [Gemmatimonadota bacterium]